MRALEIAVIEDNRADVVWLEFLLDEAGLEHHCTLAEDGEQAVDCLPRQGRYATAPVPDLILLDMHLPKFGALEILDRVPNSASLPVCMLTSSDVEKKSMVRHFGKPICYLIKPLSNEKLLACLRSHSSLAKFAERFAA
jgi:DNA-binding response OmpR family regulator